MTSALDVRLAGPDTTGGALELQYQPEVDLATGAIVAMEGLLRWHTFELSVLAPPAFFAAAEEAGTMPALAEWVLRTGAAEAAAWQDDTSFYATLAVIESLPVDVVKLGQREVRGIDERDATLVRTVVERAHARGLTVVAEGVETWGEAVRLLELGCDRAHGWLYASAQRADKARWLLEQGRGWRGATLEPGVQALPFVPSPRASV